MKLLHRLFNVRYVPKMSNNNEFFLVILFIFITYVQWNNKNVNTENFIIYHWQHPCQGVKWFGGPMFIDPKIDGGQHALNDQSVPGKVMEEGKEDSTLLNVT